MQLWRASIRRVCFGNKGFMGQIWKLGDWNDSHQSGKVRSITGYNELKPNRDTLQVSHITLQV